MTDGSGKPGKLDWFPFYAKDWLTDERVSAMTWEAQGVYLHLLCRQWVTGSLPIHFQLISQSFPKSVRVLRRLWDGGLAEFFPVTIDEDGNEVRRNPRLAKIRKQQEETRLRLSEAGRKGGKVSPRKGGVGNKPGLLPEGGVGNKPGRSKGEREYVQLSHEVSQPPPDSGVVSDPTPAAQGDTDERQGELDLGHPAGNGTVKRSNRGTYNPDSPFDAAVNRICRWFYQQEGRHQPTSDRQKDHIKLQVDRALRLDMEDTPEAQREARLRGVLEACVADDFWSGIILSLARIRERKTMGDPPKWKVAEAHLRPHTVRDRPQYG